MSVSPSRGSPRSPSSTTKPARASPTEAASAASAALPPPPRFPRPSKRPTRRTALTVETIVAAAIEVLDEAGVAGLSMRRVADQLGTGAASLYAHVSGKDELVFDELVGQVPLPEPDPKLWREQVRQMARDLRRVLMAHRDAALAGLGRVPTSPKTLAAAEALVAVLRAGGLSNRAIALGVDQLTLYVSADAFEEGLMEYGGMTPDDVQRYYEDVHAFYVRLPADRFPVLASVAEDMTGPDGDERFEFGLDVLIAGLEAVSAGTS
jgi:AcrR family transcriptional regulator